MKGQSKVSREFIFRKSDLNKPKCVRLDRADLNQTASCIHVENASVAGLIAPAPLGWLSLGMHLGESALHCYSGNLAHGQTREMPITGLWAFICHYLSLQSNNWYMCIVSLLQECWHYHKAQYYFKCRYSSYTTHYKVRQCLLIQHGPLPLGIFSIPKLAHHSNQARSWLLNMSH